MTVAGITRLKKYRAGVCAIGVNVLFFLLCMCFSHMQFGTNDDRDISNLLANVYGGEDGYYIAFVNVFLCKAFASLYKVTNNVINWYVVISVGISFIALTLVSYMIINRTKRFPIGVGLTIVMLATLCESHYVIFQFTQNAALYAAAGVMLLVDMLQCKHRKETVWRGIAGGVMILLGSMLRFQSLYFTVPYLAMFTGYELLLGRNGIRLSQWIKQYWRILLVICLCLAMAVGIRAANLLYYQQNDTAWDYYEENRMRAELMDYGMPDYDENAERLTELGISREDLALFSNQSYLDREVFNRNVVETLVSMKSEQASSYSVINLKTSAIANVFAIPDDTMQQRFWIVFFGLALFLLLGAERKRLLILLVTFVLTFAMMWYFVSVGRMPYRVWYSITAPALIACVYIGATGMWTRCTVDTGDKNLKTVADSFCYDFGIVCLILSCVIPCVSVTCNAVKDDTVGITDTYQKVIEYAEQYPNEFFLLDRPTISRLTYTSTVTPFTCFSRTSHKNVCIQGGWICWTPANLSVLERWGTPNVYRSIAEGGTKYMICTVPPEAELAFIQRHYNPNVYMECVDSINDLLVYRFRVDAE